MQPKLSPFISNITKKLSSPAEFLKLKPLHGIDKPKRDSSTESATEDSNANSSQSCGHSVCPMASPISPCSLASKKDSPCRNKSRPRSEQPNAIVENSSSGPEIETYKDLLKVTTRQNKKSPMRQHENSKESLADYKDLVAIHYRRKDKTPRRFLNVPALSLQTSRWDLSLETIKESVLIQFVYK